VQPIWVAGALVGHDRSLSRSSAERKAAKAREAVRRWPALVEIDTALIDASFVSDRMMGA